MADVTISSLPPVVTVVPGTDVLPMVSNSGADTVKVTPNQVVQAVLAAPGPIGAITPDAITGTNLTATAGTYAKSAFSGTFSDGVVVDYVSPNGRISVGTADTLTFYTGGVATTAMAVMTSTGINNTAIGATTASTGAFTTATASTSVLSSGAGGVGYSTGAGGAVTQGTSRTTPVTLNKTCGAITLFTAAGSTTAATFTVNNTTVAATDTIIVNQKSGTNLYVCLVTAIAANSFNITFYTTGGTASDTPVFNFSVIKAVAA